MSFLLFVLGSLFIADAVLMMFSSTYLTWWRSMWARNATPIDHALFPGVSGEWISRYLARARGFFIGLILIAISMLQALN